VGFQDDHDVIRWRLHLTSPPSEVHALLTTDEGRARFWAESAPARDGRIAFTFPDGQRFSGAILADDPPGLFVVRYFGGSVATFELIDDGAGGTDLSLTDRGVPDEDRTEVIVGWVSVLMALKGAVDFAVDLRNHDPRRTWEQGYAEN
jgi:uncharacterized protein YndB with AHSA1/START domain